MKTFNKEALSNKASTGFFEQERRYILRCPSLDIPQNVVRIFELGEDGTVVQTIWDGEGVGNRCYLSSYPDDALFEETHSENSSEFLR